MLRSMAGGSRSLMPGGVFRHPPRIALRCDRRADGARAAREALHPPTIVQARPLPDAMITPERLAPEVCRRRCGYRAQRYSTVGLDPRRASCAWRPFSRA